MPSCESCFFARGNTCSHPDYPDLANCYGLLVCLNAYNVFVAAEAEVAHWWPSRWGHYDVV